MQRRTFINHLGVAFGTTMLCSPAIAKPGYPEKPIRIIIPTSPGGATDAVARLFAEQVGQKLNSPIVIENVPGAATLMGVRQAAAAKPDGYTLSIMANSFTAIPHVDKNARYKTSDFKGVSYLARSKMFLVVSAQSPYRTLNDLVEAARKSPAKLSYATVGVGTSSHVPIEMLSQEAKIELTQIPYKGITNAIPDVIAGRVDMMMGTGASTNALIKNGKLRALAVADTQRLPFLADVPTFAELGFPNVKYELYLGLMAPARTPDAILQTLSQAFESVKADQAVAKRLALLDQELPNMSTPEQFNQFLLQDEQRMRQLLSKS